MMYLNAFILGGLVALLIQAIQALTKLSFVIIMITGIFIGAILTATGLMPILTGWGGAGILLTVVDLGEGYYNATLAAASGTWAPFITILMVVASLFVMGLLSALLELKLNGKSGASQITDGAGANQ